jgi:protoporphyrinogen oxidase
VLVLGAGVAGLFAADALLRAGHKVVVIEASDRPGGAHRNREIGPYSFDVGSIFYEDNARLFSLAPDLRELCPAVKRVQRRIDCAGQVRHYPLEPRDLLAWGPWRIAQAGLALLAGPLLHRRDGSLEAICLRKLGRPLYEGTGLRNYIARLHNVSPAELDEEFFFYRMNFVEKATRPKAVLRAAWRALRKRPFRSKPRAALRVRPRAGFDALFSRIRTRLEGQGVRFVFSEAIDAITPPDAASPDFRVTTERATHHGSCVISTIPLETTHRALFATGSGLVSLDLMTLFVSCGALDPGLGNVFFNFHASGRWKRATVYSRLYPDMHPDREAISVEVTLPPGAQPDPEAAFAEFAAHLRTLGLAQDLHLEGHELVPGAYPLYLRQSRDVRAQTRARILASGVMLAGRQGRFEYLPTANAVMKRVTEELEATGLIASVGAGASMPATATLQDREETHDKALSRI